jgi:hypothetical protein
MREGAQQQATEFLKELYAAGDIDAGQFDTSVGRLLAASTDAELAEVVRSLPQPIALTSPDRRLAKPLEIHSGLGRLRLAGKWQVATDTHISADLGSVRLDVTAMIGRVHLRHPSRPGALRSRSARRGSR